MTSFNSLIAALFLTLFSFSKLKSRGLSLIALVLKLIVPVGTVSTKFMLSKKKSNRLYALGSGSSVCDYDSRMWAQIAAHDSLGFNFWCLHKFVPSFYVVESAILSPLTRPLHSNLVSVSTDYDQTVFLWKNDAAAFLHLPVIRKIGAHLVDTRKYRAPTQEALIHRIVHLNKLRRNRFSVYSQSSTLDWILDFALLMGYEEVVLCGFDLSDSRYFYTCSTCKARNNIRSDLKFPTAAVGNQDRPHATADPARCCGALDALAVCECYRRAVPNSNLNVTVGSVKSRLCAVWPLHKWD